MSIQAQMNGLVGSVIGMSNAITESTEDAEKHDQVKEEVKEDFDDAERAALESQQKKINNQTNQEEALEERIKLLASLKEKGIMSNTQFKKYEHRLKAGVE